MSETDYINPQDDPINPDAGDPVAPLNEAVTEAVERILESDPPATHRSNSLLSQGRAQIARTVTRPKNVVAFNSGDLTPENSYFHFLLYSDTNMRKTTYAATFGDPLETLIILTRNQEQALPLRDDKYEILKVEDAEGLRYGIVNAEGEWALRQKNNANLRDLKFVCVDDITDGINMILDDQESKDMRKNYRDAGDELRSLLKHLRSRPIHMGLVSLAKMKENPITNRDKIGPDIPPAMLNMVGTDIEYAFYVMPETYQLLTDRSWETFSETGDDGKTKSYRVEIFAKSKLPRSLLGQTPPVIAKYEKPELRAIWDRIQNASRGSQTAKAAGATTGVVGVGTARRFGGLKK